MDFAALLMLLGLAAPPDQPPLLPPPALTATLQPQNPALRPLRQQAEAGNADAQFNLGIAWINGSAGTVNYDQARYWWEKAAAQGQRIAQYNLGVLYDEGRGVSQDYHLAAQWYRKAAQQGFISAQYNLGNLYRDGKGVPQNAYIARDWQEKAAAQGDRDAMYALGSLYRQGALGISGDGQHALAFYWLEQAAMRGHPQAQAELAGLYARGEGVVRDPAIAAKWQRAAATAQTGTENTDNSDLTAIEQTEQAAMHGDTQAQVALANHYAHGDGIAHDEEAALKWWQVAAAQGSTDAMQALARHYRDAADRSQAEHWYLAAAEKGDSNAYRELGQIYADARPPDYTTARKYWHAGKKGDPVAQYYTAAARLNDNDARYNLAHLYHYGDGVPRSDIIAHYWLTKAAAHERDAMTALGMLYQKSGTDDGTQMRASYWLEQAAMRGDAQAQYELFWRSRYGYGIEKNQETANHWLQQAAENGNVEAQYRLGVCYYNGCFAEFRQDKRTGREWLEKAAAQGDSDMRFLIGMEYFFGNDYDDARRWLQPVVTSESDYASMAVSLLDTIDRAQDKKRPAAPANTAASPHEPSAPPRDAAAEAAEWQRRAEAGDARAQYQLYFRYSLGDGVKQDQETANRWLQQAAGNGDADAQYWLGERYYDGGSGFGKDRAAAFMWLEKAAAQGGRGEQSHVGWRYYSNGDYDNARRWLQKAADQGDSTAKFYLKKIDGLQHVKRPPAPNHSAAPPRDAVAATAELQRRAEAGDTGAQGLLPCYYAEPNGAWAEYWRQCDADQGDATAQTRLGRQYYDSGDITAARHWLQQAADGGSFVVPDLLMIQTGQCFKDIYPVFEAFDTLRQRAKAGDATAQYRLSLRHLAGVHQNRREADYWLQQAAENGDLDAQYWLGQHYYHGSRGFPKDPKTAHQWLDKAAAAGGRDTRYQVGMTYFSSGEYTTARYWLQRAAAQNNPQAPSVLRAIDALTAETTPPAAALRQAAEAGSASAQYQLALRYRKGEGVTQNPTEADYWLRRAAEQEHEDAQIALALRYYDNLAGAKYHKTATMPWLEKAGTKGDAARQYQVGMIYLEHDNRVDARRWLTRAAERGDVAAAAALQLLETEYRAKRYAPSAANATQSP